MPIRVLFATLVIAALLFQPQNAAQSQPALIPVRVAVVMGDEVTPAIYAVKTGMYAKAGLDVQLIAAPSGTFLTAGVLSGSYDIGKSNLPALMNAHLRGLPVIVIGAGGLYDPRVPYEELVIAADAPYRSAKDLNGKTIGVPSLNDLNQLASRAWVDQNGGDSKTVKFVELPQSASSAALVEHRVDAAMIGYPALAEAMETGKVKILGHAYSAISNSFLITAWFASGEWAAKHPDIVKTFARVTNEAGVYTNAHHAETAAMVAELLKFPLPLVEKMSRAVAGTSLNLSEIQPLIDVAVKYSVIPRAFPAKELLGGT